MDDLDDLDTPTLTQQPPPPSRPSKFAPKNSRPKSQPASKPKPPENLAPPKPEPVEVPEPLMKMEVDHEPEPEPEPDKDKDVPMADVAVQEEDVVVREIEVFFTPSLDDNTQLYVLQCPLRPTWRPYDMDDKCKEVRVKPKTTEVEVDLSMDTDCKNHDGDAEHTMTKQTLLTRWTPIHTSGYAVGILNYDKLYLNPVHAIVQLRPSLNHIASKTKNNAVVKSEEPKGGSVSLSKKQAQSKPVQAQSKPVLTLTGEKTEDEESWVPLKYHGLDSELSTGYIKSMIKQESSPIQFTMNPYDYVNSLCPGVSNKNNKPKGPSKRYLLSLPLEERIKKLLCEGSTLNRFKFLKHFAPDHSVEEFLEVLQQHALLIHGLWTAKTALIHQGDASKCLARDYALTIFNKSLIVNLKNVHRLYVSSLKDFGTETWCKKAEDIKLMKFKESPDVSFMKLYPDIVKKQQAIMDGIETKINSHINRTGKQGAGRRSMTVVKKAPTMPNVASKPETLINSDKGVKDGASEVSMGKKTMSAETREALPKALQKLFQNYKVCSFSFICQGLRDMAVSKSSLPKADAKMVVDAAYAIDAHPEEFREVIEQIAVNIHGSYVLKNCPEHPEHDPLRHVIIGIYQGREANAKLKRAEILQAAKEALGRELTNNEYNKVMNDICECKGSAWSLKGGDGNSR